MTTHRQDFLSPVGRMVAGSMYEPQTEDMDGRPLVVKSGANAGQPAKRWFFALAIAKTPGQAHWAIKPTNWPAGQPYWGELIWNTGHLAFGNRIPEEFSWKIVDGDSTKPNKARVPVAPCTREGYPGHWVLSFSSGFPPQLVDSKGETKLTQPDAVLPGHFIQVWGSVDGNESTSKPGIYLNHNIVSLQGYHPDGLIHFGTDPRSVGFGGALPAGASAAPIGLTAPPAAATALSPPPPGAVARPVVPAPAVTGTIAVTPHPGILTPGAPLAAVAPPPLAAVAPPPAAAPVRRMTPLATAPYETYMQAGWTDALLLQHGFMTPG